MVLKVKVSETRKCKRKGWVIPAPGSGPSASSSVRLCCSREDSCNPNTDPDPDPERNPSPDPYPDPEPDPVLGTYCII